jgi:septal ring factor EnvC (AmiA/AmiB activator)
MPNRARLVAGACLLFGLSIWPLAGITATNLDRRAKTEELEHLRTRIGELSAALNKAKGQQGALQAQLQATEQAIGRVTRNLRRLGERLEETAGKLERLQEERADIQSKLAAHRSSLTQQVRAAYAMGRQQRLKVLLNQEEPSTVARALIYYDYLNRARAKQIDTAKTNLFALAEVQHQIGREQNELERLRAKRLEEVRDLEVTRETRQTILERLNIEIKTKGRELGRLKQDERELEHLLRALEEALADIPAEPGDRQPFVSLKGRLPWPISGRLLARFGQSRRVGNLVWRGVLIGAPVGGEVRAVSHGRVAFASWFRGLGLLLIIDHGDGYMSLYGHNQTLHKETGDWVEAGEVVASVGDSGGQAQAGLYFELRNNGRPVNPRTWCGPLRGPRVSMGK